MTYSNWTRPVVAPMASQKSHAEAETEVAIKVTKIGQKRVSRINRGIYRRISGSELVGIISDEPSSTTTTKLLALPSPPPGDSGGLRISSRR